MYQDREEKSNLMKYVLAAFLAVLVFQICYKYTMNDFANNMQTDLQAHGKIAESIYLDRFWEVWLKVPYLFWHLCVKCCIKFVHMPLNAATAFAHGFFAGLSCLVLFWMLDRYGRSITGKDLGIPAALTAGVLSIAQPLYVLWFQQLVQFSINPYHNPTHIAVKPFGLVCFMLGVDLILVSKGKEKLFFPWMRKTKWLYLSFSLMLLLSTFTKPTFMYMLLPGGAVFLLVDLAAALIRKDGTARRIWGVMWRMACVSLPSLAYLLIEYLAFYVWGERNRESGVAFSSFLMGWHLVSDNVPRSMCLMMAFPFWMILTNLKYFFRSVEGRLSMICFAVGTLEFAFFVEKGSRLTHLNFAWPMMSGMLLLWGICAARLLTQTAQPEPGKLRRLTVFAGWVLLFLHFCSGLYYFNPYQYII